MKKFYFLMIVVLFAAIGFSQSRVNIKKEYRNIGFVKTTAAYESLNHTSNAAALKQDIKDEYNIGTTLYDLQSNASMQNRIYRYPDGTVGATFNFSMEYPPFPDIRTGYNYFDGNSWGPEPIEGIESDRAGWPSYAPWGENGEIVVSHYSNAATDGLVINSRTEKGTGDWTETAFFGPANSGGYLWQRATTGGVNNSDLHIVALTRPVYLGGNIYEGMDGALLYSRSPDGGQNWDYENILFDDINSDFYTGFSSDIYDIATQGNNVAFLIGDSWTDLILMKSTDNGNTWTKTIIWEHPYPLFDVNNPIVTDTFYCPDGAHCLAFDNSGKVHIAFGINRAVCDGTARFWFPNVGGIGYWNEDRPSFSNNLYALCPFSDCSYSELIEDYSIIGWTQDVNGDGEISILWDDIAIYYLGLSSMPQLHIDEYSHIYIIYSSITETYQTTTQSFRHLWVRNSVDNGDNWGQFHDLNNDLIYVFSECVFPSLSPYSDDYLHLVFQEDEEPGMAVMGDEDPYCDNDIIYLKILKDYIPEYGTLSGTVTDAWTEIPLEGATVTLLGSPYSGMTPEDGFYMFLNIPVGTYTVICTKPDYLPDTAIVNISCCGTIRDFQLESTILQPPQNLLAEIDCYDMVLQWEMPAGNGLQSFNIYRDWILIGNTTELTYFEILAPEATYEFCVSAVYDTGESECSDVVTVSIDDYLSPKNFSAILFENDVVCFWDTLKTKEVLGYRVFRNDEDVSGLLTETAFHDINPGSGTFYYYVKAEYNNCLSDASDTVAIVLPGIDENIHNLVEIYPNPAIDFIFIKSDYFITGIKVYNHTGQKIVEEIIKNRQYKFNAAILKQGLYLFEIKTEEGSVPKHIIIE